MIFKLESAKEVISENLKIATVLKALPEEFESFNAAIKFQKNDYNELKNKLIEKSLCLPSRGLTIEESSNVVIAKILFDKPKKNKPVYKCANCGRTNHKTQSCFAPGGKLHKPKQKTSAVSGLAKSDDKLVLASHYNCKNKLLIDSGCTDHILTDQRFFKEISKLSPVKYVCNVDLSKPENSWHWFSGDVLDANGTHVVISFEQALFVPEYKFNFLSMKQLVEKNNYIPL